MVENLKNKVTKHMKLKKNFRNTRKSKILNKFGGAGSAERLAVTNKKAYDIFSKLDSLIDVNREYTENIYSKIDELKKLYGIKTSKHVSPSYDIGAAEHVSPSYDIGAAEHVSPSYDIGAAEHVSPSYDIAAAAEESEYVLLEPLVKGKKKKNTVPFVIKHGTWDFFILQILDNEPKSENEISGLMKEKFPTRMSGKTPDNTLNTRLQILVKEGYANRAEYKKGSRKIYKYFLPSDV